MKKYVLLLIIGTPLFFIQATDTKENGADKATMENYIDMAAKEKRRDMAAKEGPMDKAALGKLLFSDPILSKDYSVSCANCHKPQYAFADTSAVSVGVAGKKGVRNTP